MTFVSKKQSELISVLLPVRNEKEFLPEALESIFDQTYENFEIVAVDHGSTDGTSKILSRFQAMDRRLRVVRFEGESFVDCLNFGLSQCRGEFIARMDADDVCKKERLYLQKEFLKKRPEIGIAGSLIKIFSSSGVKEGYRRYEKWINSLVEPADIEREIFIESPLPHPSVMMRRETAELLGGYRDFGWAEDYDMWLRARFAGIRMAKVTETLLEWRDRPGRFSRSNKIYSRKNFHRARAFYLAKLAGKKSVVIQGAGTTGKHIGRYLRMYGAGLSAFFDVNPRKIGGTKLGLPVFGPEKLGMFFGSMLIAAVSSWGAREEIRPAARAAGFTEGVDFFCAS